MKNRLKFLAVILIAAFMQSCVPEDQVTPDNGDIRDKFTGTWLFNENTQKSSLNVIYTVEISLDPSNTSQVLLTHFAGYSGSTKAYGIVTSNRISVPSQVIGTDFRVEGTGTLANSSTMDWTVTKTAGGEMSTNNAIATKQ